MNAVALSAGDIGDLFLLVLPAEVEARYIGAGINFQLAELHYIQAAGDHFPDILCRVQCGAMLVGIGQLYAVSDPEFSRVRLFLAGYHLKQGGLAGAVGPDDADYAAGRQRETDIVQQHLVAEGLGDVLGLYDQVAQARTRRDEDLQVLAQFLAALAQQVLVGGDAGL